MTMTDPVKGKAQIVIFPLQLWISKQEEMLPKQIAFMFLLFAQVKNENPLLMPSTKITQVENIAECLLKLSAKYFVDKKALSGSIVIVSVNSYASTTESLLFRTIHGGIKYSIMVKDSLFPHANASHFREKAKNYMLVLEEKNEIKRYVMQLIKLPTWNPLAKTIVYYQLRDDEESEETAIFFINEFRIHQLLQTIVFIYSPEAEEMVSYSWSPYSYTNCGGMCDSVYVLDRCKNKNVVQIEPQKEMFPSDMKGCPLIAFAVVSEPYVMPPTGKLTNSTFEDTYEFRKGGEINLVKIISQFTNMSLIIRMSDTAENWGTVYPNGTATGAYGVLRDEKADLVIGNIEVSRILRKWFDPTVSYTQDEMTWCVPKAGKASTWDNLVIIFQWSTWVATFVSLVIMGLVFHYLYYKEHNGNVTKWPTNSLLMTFSMLLGWGATFEPKSATFRILLFGWLCFSINMSISYESFLRSFLMHPRFEKQINTEADLIQSKIPLGGREIYRVYFETNNASSFYLYRKYNSTSFAEGITRAALKRNFAVVASRRQAEYQDEKLGKGANLIYCFPESHNLYKYGVVLLARKWFPFLGKFDNIIRSVSENGLIDKWNKEAFIHKVRAEGTSTIAPLGIKHLLGAFMFLGFLYGASVVVFIGELTIGYISERNFSMPVFKFKGFPINLSIHRKLFHFRK